MERSELTPIPHSARLSTNPILKFQWVCRHLEGLDIHFEFSRPPLNLYLWLRYWPTLLSPGVMQYFSYVKALSTCSKPIKLKLITWLVSDGDLCASCIYLRYWSRGIVWLRHFISVHIRWQCNFGFYDLIHIYVCFAVVSNEDLVFKS